MSTNPDPLEPLFDRWREETPPLGRSVQSEVWNRIEQSEANPGLVGWLTRIEIAFSRPAFATAFVIAAVLLGLFLAETRLSNAERHRSAEIERSYLRLLDPQIENASAQLTPTTFRP